MDTTRAMVDYKNPELGARKCPRCQDDPVRRDKIFPSNWKYKRHLAYVHNDPPQQLSYRKLNKGKSKRGAVREKMQVSLLDEEFMDILESTSMRKAMFPDPITTLLDDKKFMDTFEQNMFTADIMYILHSHTSLV